MARKYEPSDILGKFVYEILSMNYKVIQTTTTTDVSNANILIFAPIFLKRKAMSGNQSAIQMT